MGLRYVVLTSVNRDDLPDGGAAHFAETVRAIRRALPGAAVEVLTPDFKGDRARAASVLDAAPEVFNHNIETVPRLFPRLRPQGRYALSLERAAAAKQLRPGAGDEERADGRARRDATTRSSRCCATCAPSGVDTVTIGQYLRPTREHEPVHRYVTPEAFRGVRAARALARLPGRLLGRLRALLVQRRRGVPRRGAR